MKQDDVRVLLLVLCSLEFVQTSQIQFNEVADAGVGARILNKANSSDFILTMFHSDDKRLSHKVELVSILFLKCV